MRFTIRALRRRTREPVRDECAAVLLPGGLPYDYQGAGAYRLAPATVALASATRVGVAARSMPVASCLASWRRCLALMHGDIWKQAAPSPFLSFGSAAAAGPRNYYGIRSG